MEIDRHSRAASFWNWIPFGAPSRRTPYALLSTNTI